MGARLEGDQRPRPPSTGDVVPSLLKVERQLSSNCFLSEGIQNKNMGVEEAERGKKYPDGKWERDSDQADTGYLLLFVSPYLTSQEEGEGFVRQRCYLPRAAGSSRVPMAESLWWRRC